ncbi:probable E3 ubiquitin-protein ligase HERC4 isoform X2 [Artemia franciscana]|uniref:probable E3 ubiquitin-protein ligase HERC4 isoform X2 n=1 Tax=Artemia franciscana TaxID=6661 RepID=UPI0032DA22DD
MVSTIAPDLGGKWVVCGENHTLMVLSDGQIWSCGSNDYGQLGQNKARKRPEPVDNLHHQKIVKAAAGFAHSLALGEWGQIFSWGWDASGQLGHNIEQNSVTMPRLLKSLASKHVIQIACGLHHSMALTNSGEIFSWGSNVHGQLGLGCRDMVVRSPMLVKSLVGMPISYIVCGGYHSFAVSKSGAVFGWGKNTFGQIGLGDCQDRTRPYLLSSLENQKIVYMCCGRDHSVALTKDGGVFTFGAGMYGQLGHGSTVNEFRPRRILELMGSTVTQIAAGRCHSLAFVPSRGQVYSFGLGGSGQLGCVSSPTNISTPQTVIGGKWVSSSGTVPPTSEANDNVEMTDVESSVDGNDIYALPFAIDRIFAGGDQSFAMVKAHAESFVPADCRVREIKDSILEVNTSSVKKIKQWLSEDSEGLEALTFVESVFQSSSCLNGSFLKNESHYGCSSSNHGIEIGEVESTFDQLSRVKSESILNGVFQCLTGDMVPNFNLPSPHPETLRVFISVPFYHEMMMPKHFAELQIPFARLLLDVINDKYNEAVIDNWYEDLPADCFLRVIGIYKKIIVHVLNQPGLQLTAPCRDENLRLSLEVLRKFYAINQKRTKQIGCEKFYVPELTGTVHIPKDYVQWSTRDSPVSGFFFCNYPFLFDAMAKTVLLQTDQALQMQSAASDNIGFLPFLPREIANQIQFLNISVSRENIVGDTICQLVQATTRDLKKPLKVKFAGEEAEDLGGVRKEFFILILRDILDPKYGMFKEYEETRSVWFSEFAFEHESTYSLVGLLCGLAIYNFTIINLPFPLVLYKKLLKEPVGLADVADLSPQIHRSLISILEYEGDDFEETFSLTFDMQHEVFGEVITVPLKPGLEGTPVTQSNKHEYVDLYADYLLNKSIEKQYDYFHKAFHKVCGGNVLGLFQSWELLELVVGSENYDWHELQRSAEYRNGYSADHPTIKLFWEVFHELKPEEKKNFLKFLTGSDRVPILGMKSVKICIQPTGGGDAFLPVAHTCFNLLDLPQYHTKEKLRYKLLQSIQCTEGFALA